MGWFKKHIVIMYEILKKNQTKQNQTTTNKNQGLASQPVVARKKKKYPIVHRGHVHRGHSGSSAGSKTPKFLLPKLLPGAQWANVLGGGLGATKHTGRDGKGHGECKLETHGSDEQADVRRPW